MRKSIMKSMISGCVAVIFITFIVITPMFFMTIQKDEINLNYSNMESSIDHVMPLAKMSLNFNTQKMYRLFDESMRQYSYFTDSDILFFNIDGSFIWSNRELDADEAERKSAKAIEAIRKDNYVKATRLLDELYNSQTQTIGEYITDDFGNNTYIILYTRDIPDVVYQYKDAILKILFMEIIAIIFISGFMYVFSSHITGPLKKINRAVTEFSKGNFESRVVYRSENELGELADNINIMADNLKNLERMRSSFISDVSHELRTPMTSISGFVEGIIDGTIPQENSEKYLKIVLSEAKRLSRLVDDLLNVSRIDSEKLKINKSDFDIVELSKLVLIKFEDAISKKNLDVSFEVEEQSCSVYADRDSMTQVLTNLIHNAVKFAPEGGYIKISISEDIGSSKCVFYIENNGAGIEKEKLKYVWDRFYKADESRGSDKTGVGLGLYIVMRIINEHGEIIVADSKPNEYTSFEFTITLSD